jgi:inactivated superfamily I helicase
VPPSSPNAIEFAGWLDLALDDAPVLVVTNMNDEHVPSSEVGHQFLPNELCRQLGILDNDRRYARDIYALTVLAAVRENLLLIAGRRNEQGDPKQPAPRKTLRHKIQILHRMPLSFLFKTRFETRHRS